MTKRYERIPGTSTWRCLKCGKVVEAGGWPGHMKKHKEKIHQVNRHLDTF